MTLCRNKRPMHPEWRLTGLGVQDTVETLSSPHAGRGLFDVLMSDRRGTCSRLLGGGGGSPRSCDRRQASCDVCDLFEHRIPPIVTHKNSLLNSSGISERFRITFGISDFYSDHFDMSHKTCLMEAGSFNSCYRESCYNNYENNNNNNETLIKRESLVYTRARCAVQKKKKRKKEKKRG